MRVVKTRIWPEPSVSPLRVADLKIDIRSVGASDPVALAFQNVLRPAGFDLGHVVQQLIGVGSRFQEPLIQVLFGDRISASPAQTAACLLVRKRSLVGFSTS